MKKKKLNSYMVTVYAKYTVFHDTAQTINAKLETFMILVFVLILV